jgi:hypothetical protein
VATLVDEEDVEGVGERIGRGQQFSGTARKAVEENERGPVTAPIGDGDRDVIAMNDVRGRDRHGEHATGRVSVMLVHVIPERPMISSKHVQ